MVAIDSHSSHPILVVGPAWIGDMVMAHSLFQLLHQEIHVLAPAWTEPLLKRMPEVHRTIPMPIPHGKLHFKQRYQLAKQLKNVSYTQAILLPNSVKSALIPWLAGIKKRTGWVGEWRFGLLNDYRWLNKNNLPLMVERFAALSLPANTPLPDPLPLPRLTICPTNLAKVITLYHLSPNNRPILGLCPGAAFGPSKCWPATYYATLAKEKIEQGWQVWLFGSKNDQQIAKTIQKEVDNINLVDLTGRTPLDHAIDLMSLTTQVVTNDSGLMHIAAALDRPLVALYGSTSPVFTPPLSKKACILQLDLPCQPCFKRKCPLKHFNCMNQLLPHQVLTALENLPQ